MRANATFLRAQGIDAATVPCYSGVWITTTGAPRDVRWLVDVS
jgi:hypothetical protein